MKKKRTTDGGTAAVKSEDGGGGGGGGAAAAAPNGAAAAAAPAAGGVKETVGSLKVEVVSEGESDEDEEGDLVSRGARLEAATGPASAYLKPYQLVGINFLLLLYRQKVRGGEEGRVRLGGVPRRGEQLHHLCSTAAFDHWFDHP